MEKATFLQFKMEKSTFLTNGDDDIYDSLVNTEYCDL